MQYADGTCGQNTTSVDQCSNINGVQTTVPDGYTQNIDGTCTKKAGQCLNGTIDDNGNCVCNTGYTLGADGSCHIKPVYKEL